MAVERLVGGGLVGVDVETGRADLAALETGKQRRLVENAFEKIKRWRGLATRYCKRAKSFEAAVQVRCLALWLHIS